MEMGVGTVGHDDQPAPPIGSTTDLLATIARLEAASAEIIEHDSGTWSRLAPDVRTDAVGRIERCRKKLTQADSAFITAHAAELPSTPQRRTLAVSKILNTTKRDAKARLACWSRISERTDPWSPDPSAAHPDHMPHLSDLVSEGGIDAAGIEKADRQIRALPLNIQAEITRAADAPVADLARAQGPDILDSLRTFLLDLAGAEEPYTEPDHNRMRSLTLGRQGPDGMTPIRGLLTPILAASVQRLMADHAKTGDLLDDADAEDDDRTPEQRRHDAFAAAVHSAYGRGLPLSTGRGATTVVAVMPIEQLVQRRGSALTDVGVHVPVSTLLESPELETYLQVLGFDGRTLYLGRSRRLANLDQYLALVGEEGLSSAPGTDSAPAHSHVHHINGWKAGGLTDLDNLTLVSPAMHAQVDDTRTNQDRWWTERPAAGEGRRVNWIPPKTHDPHREPVHNDHPTTWTHPGTARRRAIRESDEPD